MNKIFTGKRQLGKTKQMIQAVARDFDPVSGDKILCIGFNIDHAQEMVKLLKCEIIGYNPYGLSQKSIDKIVEGTSIENYLENFDVWTKEFQYIILDETQLILEKIFPTNNLYSTFLVNKDIVEVDNPFISEFVNKKY